MTPGAENALKKAENGIQRAKQVMNSLKAVDRAQAQEKLKSRQNKFGELSQEASLARVETVQSFTYE